MSKSQNESHTANSNTISLLKRSLLLSVGVSMLALPTAAFAQDDAVVQVPDTASGSSSEVVVTGIRQVIQDAIKLKREAVTVVDGLSADEIGDLPALSIAEALEQITSIGSQREGSGATEVSIRGLGPFLGSTVINGREATNGSGDRSVNFSQFPSELFNKIEVYKTQDASLIEGGVAGQIALSTLKPLEYGKRRVQLQAKGSVQPQNLALTDSARDVGYRLTGSYVDQWENNQLGEFGISIGGQLQRRSNAEQEARSTSTFQACRIALLDNNSCNDGIGDAPFSVDPSDPNFEAAATAFSEDNNNQSATIISPSTGQPFGVSEPFVLTSSSRSFRQNITDDNRDSVFGAVQWRPNQKVDINVDVQWSDRTFTEFRSDLIIDANDLEEPIAAGGNPDDTIFELTTFSDGSLRTGTTRADIEVNSQFSERSERYVGLGGNVSYDVTDRLNVTVDASYSDTNRQEDQVQARALSANNVTAGIEVFQNGSDAHQFTFLDFDVTDPSNFGGGSGSSDLRVREDLNQSRSHTITAIRGDVSYDVDHSIFKSVQGGVRFSALDFDALPRIREETTLSGGELGQSLVEACANGSFPEPDFLDEELNGPGITNIASVSELGQPGNVITEGTGTAFVTFDGLCLAEAVLDAQLGRGIVIPDAPSDFESLGLDDIEEDTLALYALAEFNTEFKGLPIRGNVGLRYVDTTLTSDNFRTDFDVIFNDEGQITDIVDSGGLTELNSENSYTELLPSLNVVVDVKENVLFRGGVFRAISRPDPGDLGGGRTFSFLTIDDTADGPTSIEEVVGGVTSSGNPFLEPFTSWNYDAAVEWYPNSDSILAIGAYYKSFNGGFENVLQNETFVVGGQEFETPVSVISTTNENNNIFGVEMTASHAFTYLPGVLSGTGFRVSYNYADSNFEIEDGNLGEAVTFDENGEVTDVRLGFIPPADLPGLSTHTANGQVYWNIGKTTLTGIGKYRSEFFQPSNTTPTLLRRIEGAFVLDARFAYKLNKNIKFSLEATNILNTARRQTNPTVNNFAEINVFGPRLFAGVTAKF